MQVSFKPLCAVYIKKGALKRPLLSRKFSTNNLLERDDYAVIFKRGVQNSTQIKNNTHWAKQQIACANKL